MKDEVNTAIDIMEKTNKFWRDALRDEGVSEFTIGIIYSSASKAVEYFRDIYK